MAESTRAHLSPSSWLLLALQATSAPSLAALTQPCIPCSSTMLICGGLHDLQFAMEAPIGFYAVGFHFKTLSNTQARITGRLAGLHTWQGAGS